MCHISIITVIGKSRKRSLGRPILLIAAPSLNCQELTLSVWGLALKLQYASTGKCKYGKVKYKVAKCVRVENTSTEKSNIE